MTVWKLFLDDDADGSREPSISVENPRWRASVGLPLSVPDHWHLGSWLIARCHDEAIDLINKHGFPNFASFDHDLGDGKDGIAVVRYLIELDLDKACMPEDFAYEAHSANPVGRANIRGLLDNYLSVRQPSIVLN